MFTTKDQYCADPFYLSQDGIPLYAIEEVDIRRTVRVWNPKTGRYEEIRQDNRAYVRDADTKEKATVNFDV